MNYINKLDREDYKLARAVEKAGYSTVSNAAKTIYRANDGDENAIEIVKKWEEMLNV